MKDFVADKILDNRPKTAKETESDIVEDDDELEIKDYMRFVIFCMKSMAMLPIFIDHGQRMLDLVNILYIIFVNFISIHITLFSVADVLLRWDGNVFTLTFNMINTVIYATNTCLLFYFQWNWKELWALHNHLNNTFRFRSARGLTVLNMRASFEKARLLSIMFVVSCLIGSMHWAFLPMFTPVTDGVRLLPLKVWYPLDVQQSPNYELAYFFQFFGQIMVAMTFSNFGILFLSECLLICGQFDILCCSLRNMRYTALRRRGFPVASLVQLAGYSFSGPNRCTLPEDEADQYQCGHSKILDGRLKINLNTLGCEDELNETEQCQFGRRKLYSSLGQELQLFRHLKRKVTFKDLVEASRYITKVDSYTEYNREILTVINDCIKHHQEILHYCTAFEAFCSPISLVKMFQITLLACFVMYSLSVSFQITILEYGTLLLWDLFLLCYFGNEVKIRSSMVAQVASTGLWHVIDARVCRGLVPLIIRASRPVSFSGGNFYMLNVENFIGVLKASFSYFTLLRNMNEGHSQK